MAVELIKWTTGHFCELEKKMTLLIDEGYASNEVISGANEVGVKVVTRLRKDSVFYEPPCQQEKRGRGRPRKYGVQIDLQSDRHYWIRIQCLDKTID